MPPFTEQLLEVMEAILCQASAQNVDEYALFSSTFGTKEDLDFLLQLSAQMAGSKTVSSILTHLTRVIPFLTFVNDTKMDALIEYFRQSLDFSQYDTEHNAEQVKHEYCFFFVLFFKSYKISIFIRPLSWNCFALLLLVLNTTQLVIL
jgi:hypothetical protein